MNKSLELIVFFLDLTEESTLYRCRTEECSGRTSKKKDRSGYNNLLNHLRTCAGPDLEEVHKSSSRQQMLLQMGFTSIRDRNVHEIIDWITSRNQLFSEVNHNVTRPIFRTKRICAKTDRNYILNLVPIVDKNIFELFPEHVALEFDEWLPARTRYVGVLLAYSTSTGSKESLIVLASLLEMTWVLNIRYL